MLTGSSGSEIPDQQVWTLQSIRKCCLEKWLYTVEIEVVSDRGNEPTDIVSNNATS